MYLHVSLDFYAQVSIATGVFYFVDSFFQISKNFIEKEDVFDSYEKFIV